MPMRRKGPLCKNNIVSVRITDQEMDHIRELMDLTRKNASEIMREAFQVFASQSRGRGAGKLVSCGEVRCSGRR